MQIGDKVKYEKDDYIYEGIVIAIKKDNTSALISVFGIGDVIEIPVK